MAPILITILMTTLVNNVSPMISTPTRPLSVCEEIAIELQLAIDASILTPEEAYEIFNRCYDLQKLQEPDGLYIRHNPRTMGHSLNRTTTT
jgi:hypothetical protein